MSTIFSGVCEVAGISVSKSCDCKLPAIAISESFPVAVPLKDAWPFRVTGIGPPYPAALKYRLPFAQIGGGDRKFERGAGGKCSGSANLGGAGGGIQLLQLQFAGAGTVDSLSVSCDGKLRVRDGLAGGTTSATNWASASRGEPFQRASTLPLTSPASLTLWNGREGVESAAAISAADRSLKRRRNRARLPVGILWSSCSRARGLRS